MKNKCFDCGSELNETEETFNLYGKIYQFFKCPKCKKNIPIVIKYERKLQ